MKTLPFIYPNSYSIYSILTQESRTFWSVIKKLNLKYNQMKKLIFFFSSFILLSSCNSIKKQEDKIGIESNPYYIKAQATLDSIYKYYSADSSNLLRETYPHNKEYNATYLASSDLKDIPNQYSYLWPYSGIFSAVSILLEDSGDKKYQELLNNKVLSGLEKYFDTKRMPPAYASYINSAPESDRFYDDNIWLGIDFTDVYRTTSKPEYLQKAKLIWDFIMSGTDSKLGGGIYWCEQKKESKNTCSNAPGSVFALKLFEATQDSTFFIAGKNLYDWTQTHLQDTTDFLYYDNVKLDGSIGKEKYAYNSGQMMQAASILYKLTNDKTYLSDAQNIAKSCYNYFFFDFSSPQGENFKLLKKGNIWFTAVMFRGFTELYNIDNNNIYIDAFGKNLNYIWEYSRDDKGLFNDDWSGATKNESKWLLTQAAMVEMYTRMVQTRL